MKRNLFLCCNQKDLPLYKEKVRRALGDSVKIMDTMGQADLVYAIGEVSPGMQQQLDQAKAAGIKSVHVNENLVNEEIYKRTLRGRNAERDR